MGGEHEYYGHIHRAAHYYYYGDIDRLRRPPGNFTGLQTKITAKQDCCDGVNVFYLPYLTNGIWPTITLKEYGAQSFYIFRTTIHEIAHSTHASTAIFIFPIAESRMRETYAETIEWFLTTRYYSQRNPAFIYSDNYQDKTPLEDLVYTSFMVDMVDTLNQRIILR